MKADELKEIAVEWLCKEYPTATVLTEMSVADWGGAMLDVAAITDDKIIGIEIKGEGDSPSRLELQGLKYGQVAKEMWLLVTPEGTLDERCNKKRPRGWGRLEIFNGQLRPYNRHVEFTDERIEVKGGGYSYKHIRSEAEYRPLTPSISRSLNPWAMCGTLWKDELRAIANGIGLKLLSKTPVHVITDMVIENMPVPKLHDAMIEQLRKRQWKRTVIDPRAKPKPQGTLL